MIDITVTRVYWGGGNNVRSAGGQRSIRSCSACGNNSHSNGNGSKSSGAYGESVILITATKIMVMDTAPHRYHHPSMPSSGEYGNSPLGVNVGIKLVTAIQEQLRQKNKTF